MYVVFGIEKREAPREKEREDSYKEMSNGLDKNTKLGAKYS